MNSDLFNFDKKERKLIMVRYEVLRDKLYGDCVGAIYIDMVNHASKVMLDARTLKEFCERLYNELYPSDTWDNGEKFFCFNENCYYFNDLQANLMAKNLSWFRVYHNHDCQFCDQIKIQEISKVETIAEDVCINEAFDIMRKEIDDNMTDCQFRVKAYQEVYDCLEHYKQSFFFIVDEEKSCMVTFATFDMEKYYARYSISYINEEFTIKKYTKGDQE